MPNATTLRAIQPGAEVLEALTELGKGGDAWVSGTGELESVELRVAGEGTDPVRPLRGRFTLLQLSGPLGGPYSVMLARASDVGIEVLGGVLLRGRSLGVTLAVHALAAPLPAAARALATSPGRADATPVPATPSPTDKTGTVWASAAMASARARARDAAEVDETQYPEAGDLVDHFAFGRCEVLTADGDRLRIRDINGANRIREVSLSMLKVAEITEADGKRVFQLARKAPG